MPDRGTGKGMRALSRFALIGLIGGASAACSSDAVRLDPFSNPFSSSASGDPGATGSLPEGRAVGRSVRATPIQSRPLAAPVATAPLSSPQAAAPAQTPRVAAAAPVTGGVAGWSAAGGTTITVGANDSLSQMSTRFGVPAAAILQANGLSSAGQVTAGRQIVIPVYHAGGAPAMSARAVPAAPAPRIPVAETRAAEPVRRVAEVAPRPEPVRREPEPAPEPVRKAHARPGQAEGKPVAPAAAERAAKLNPRKPEPRDDEEVVAKPQRPEKVAARPEKAVSKVAARQQDDDDETVPAKPHKPEPKAAKAEGRKPEHAKVAEAVKPEPKKVEVTKVEVKTVETKKVEAKKQAEAPKPEPKKVAEAKPAPKPEPVKPVKVAALPEKAPEPAPAPAVAPPAPAPEPQANFRWPARGRVISGYDSKSNEGINIAVPEGTPVKAAEEGTVAYAGSDVKGYGKLVLVRHANGYVSAYAHNGEIDVRPGEKVKRGQVIAKSGASGNVTSPQLHFEIRKGAVPVDPVPHLASN